MINELYRLIESLDDVGIVTEQTHPKYKLIPKVTKKTPCVHIILDKESIYKIESVGAEQAAKIRKYGTNKGTFPAVNLAPLYRLTDEAEKKMISHLMDGKSTDFNVEEIHQLCRENNWGNNFEKKFQNGMEAVPQEITELLQETETVFTPLQQLIEETSTFKDAVRLHKQLERAVFAMLEQKKEIVFALQILFHFGKQDISLERDYGTLSVVFDCRKSIRDGMSTVAAGFTKELNKNLVEADAARKSGTAEKEIDAFGQVFEPFEEPMPTVKLAAGFEVSLRTMYRGQPCQSRYGRFGSATYPISKEKRLKLQAALVWMGSVEHKEVTWLSIDKNEALFAYPETLQKNMYSMVSFCRRQSSAEDKSESGREDKIRNNAQFESAAKIFIGELQKTKRLGTDPMSERIQYFVLKKLDKAKTKVVYAYNTSPAEIERSSERWSSGCQNLPIFIFDQPQTLFPLEVSDILNLIWRQDGKPSTDKFKPIPRYYGMRLLFGQALPAVRRTLFVLMKNVSNMAPYIGKTGLPRRGREGLPVVLLQQTRKALALMGLLLYQLGIRKEKYMQEFPYLFGQLLKLSDALHEMYCRVVRDNDVPNALAGSGLYSVGAEQPYKTLAVLGQRMNPYITWAKSYRTKGIQKKDEESWRTGWYLALYERIATQLYEVWRQQTRFREEEKAQYFIGYLAAFPKKEKKEGEQGVAQTEDEKDESKNNFQKNTHNYDGGS